MELYADYNYYLLDWVGSEIPTPEEYFQYASKAQIYLNYVTSHRISDVTTNVKNALCAATEELYKSVKAVENIPIGVKSESNDGVSVTYTERSRNQLAKERKQLMYAAIQEELSGTGLLYRGC